MLTRAPIVARVQQEAVSPRNNNSRITAKESRCIPIFECPEPRTSDHMPAKEFKIEKASITVTLPDRNLGDSFDVSARSVVRQAS